MNSLNIHMLLVINSIRVKMILILFGVKYIINYAILPCIIILLRVPNKMNFLTRSSEKVFGKAAGAKRSEATLKMGRRERLGPRTPPNTFAADRS